MTEDNKKGKAAEYIFCAKCLLLNYDVFIPLVDSIKVDVICNGYKTQVKCINKGNWNTCNGVLPVRKYGRRFSKEPTIVKYSESDIDFLVGVDISSFVCYIVPVNFSYKYQASIAVNTLVKYGYCNNFEVLSR